MAKRHRRKSRTRNAALPMVMGLLLIGLAMIWLALPRTSSAADEKREPASFAPLAVQFPAPDLALDNINGQTESLEEYRTKVVLVNNWATWCPPCKAEMPVLESYYEEHAGEGFTIIAVEAGDPQDVVSEFVRSYGLTFPVWLDPDGAALRAFGNGNLPNSYVIDRQGVVRYAWTGQVSRTALEKYVTPLLAE